MGLREKDASGQDEPVRGGAGRPRSAKANRAILQAAMMLFARRGFDGVTLEQVAVMAGVARTTLYRRWSSKEELLAQAIATERGAPENAILTGSEPSAVLRDQLAEAIADVATAPGYRDMIAHLIGSVPDHPELMSVYWHTYLAPRRAAMRDLLERARAAGLVRDDLDPEIVLDLIGGVIMHELLLRPGERSARDLRDHLRKAMRALGLETGREKRL